MRAATKEHSGPKASAGTTIAAKARARANTYSDAKREALMERGMALIYGGGNHVKAAANVNRG